MVEGTLVERLARQLGRRIFLIKLGTGTVAALLGLMGQSKAVFAYCCGLCHTPGPWGVASCPIAWCWTCPSGCQTWRCCEYFNGSAPNCTNTCEGTYASSATCILGCCPSAPSP
jgi:hypothetical protein